MLYPELLLHLIQMCRKKRCGYHTVKRQCTACTSIGNIWTGPKTKTVKLDVFMFTDCLQAEGYVRKTVLLSSIWNVIKYLLVFYFKLQTYKCKLSGNLHCIWELCIVCIWFTVDDMHSFVGSVTYKNCRCNSLWTSVLHNLTKWFLSQLKRVLEYFGKRGTWF